MLTRDIDYIKTPLQYTGVAEVLARRYQGTSCGVMSWRADPFQVASEENRGDE